MLAAGVGVPEHAMAGLALSFDAEVEKVTRYALRAASELRRGRRSASDAALAFFVLCRIATGLVYGLELHGRRRPRDGRAPLRAMADALWTLRDTVYGELRGDAERPRGPLRSVEIETGRRRVK